MEKIIITEENKERWIINQKQGIVTRQEFRRDYQYLSSSPYWHNDITLKIETLKKLLTR